MAEQPEYSLVMPFVVTTSNGGALDDHSFVVGTAFGQHMAELKACPRAQSWAEYVSPEMVPQYDLLAMHLGYEMAAEPWAEFPDEWVLVTFTRPEPTMDGEGE